ncbi:hypothetical protein VNO78_05080 [Psophocarpus tetragonolobus]|uniref:Uncharacterized protein n=1 Tax=Psophocarpus tetragonolobus TaxID=3891 RepID=A0AAN9SZ43_PSOTE
MVGGGDGGVLQLTMVGVLGEWKEKKRGGRERKRRRNGKRKIQEKGGMLVKEKERQKLGLVKSDGGGASLPLREKHGPTHLRRPELRCRFHSIQKSER